MRQANTINPARVATVSLEDTENPIKRFLKRNLIAATGLLIIVLAVSIAASLATWTITDPSLSHATTGPTQNALGTPGAILSDLLMQTVGLSTAIFIFPILVWGWRVFWRGHSGFSKKRFASWLGGTIVFAGGLAALPVNQAWPLPTGLGGFLGDWVFAVPSAFLPQMSESVSTLVGVIGLGLPALFLLAHAAGWVGRDAEPVAVEEAPVATRYDDEDYDDEEDDHLSTVIGRLSHWKLMVTSAVKRTMNRQKAQPAASAAAAATHDDYEDDYDHQEEGTYRRGYTQNQRTQQADVYDDEDDFVEEELVEDEKPAGLVTRLRRSVANRLMPKEDDGLDEFYDASKDQPQQGANAPYDQDIDDDQYDRRDYAHHDQEDFPPYQGDWEPDVPHAYDDDDYYDHEQDHRHEHGHDHDVDPYDYKEQVTPDTPAPAPRLRPVGIAAPLEPAPTAQPQARVVPQAPAPIPAAPARKEVRIAEPQREREYELPPTELLQEAKDTGRGRLSRDALEQNARILEGVLEDFGVRGEIIEVRPGPVVTLYELAPAPGIKSSRVIGLADDIARSMSAISARVAVIPGKNAIGIELPNATRETVYLRELIAAQDFDRSKAKLAMALGKTINGEPVIADLARMPHLLVAGTTGSGKSVSINTMILSLLYRLTPEQCKMIMIDPKMLELSIYDGIPHLLTPVVTDPNKAVVALKWTVREMEDRYKKMSKMGVRNIDGYNTRIEQAMKKGDRFTRTVQTGFDKHTGEPIFEEEELPLEKMPYIVVVVDEMADLMMVAGKDIEGAIQRLAQMARAAGIHLIMATQRPSVDVITGTIKANFPTRISFQVTSKIDSRTILGEMGAEQLLGMGDMLYMAAGGKTQRVHGPFVSDDEVEDIVNHLKEQGVPQYLESVTEEEEEAGGYDSLTAGSGNASNDLFDQAVAIVARDKKASTSYIQRRLSIGYNRAASLIERMEQEGIIGPANHAGKREILLRTEDEEF
ncbi:DNA translocase FtsK [Rhodobacteraceae bacterium RKSG542]|uniref:DNA translocase FtsK n=1 Tax=Pseudovibrio flavus TaxID=2529854 RepID=UPI0012BBF9F4|nr:DNA translocase FtsK [Pseudovibrio flavus]MTI18413.1 DNA translocase FtsK [Pseudovibrio flavus]